MPARFCLFVQAHFCPSCHQKRVVEFGEWLCNQVLKLVPHRQWVFSLPKRSRIYFLFNRKFLAKLSGCVWKVLSTYLKQVAPFDDASPGGAIAVHIFRFCHGGSRIQLYRGSGISQKRNQRTVIVTAEKRSVFARQQRSQFKF